MWFISEGVALEIPVIWFIGESYFGYMQGGAGSRVFWRLG